jgi:hypothetical protein
VVWCDNDPKGCGIIKHGAQWEGGSVVALDELEEGGKQVTFREVFSGFTENSFTQTLYMGEPGGELKKVLTITATRKAG